MVHGVVTGHLSGYDAEVSRGSPFGFHPHVQRTVNPIREPALGGVELHGRHSEIEEDAVDRPRDIVFR